MSTKRGGRIQVRGGEVSDSSTKGDQMYGCEVAVQRLEVADQRSEVADQWLGVANQRLGIADQRLGSPVRD